jgi:co-chaperonin GroES (HSP10)
MNPETIQPLGDFVLVRRLPDQDSVRGIIAPQSALNKKRGDDRDISGSLRRGIVVAVGPGDKLFWFECPYCREFAFVAMKPKNIRSAELVLRPPRRDCRCGTNTKWRFVPSDSDSSIRCAMNVSVGNEVITERWPHNTFDWDGEEYQILHEEQSILAVIER